MELVTELFTAQLGWRRFLLTLCLCIFLGRISRKRFRPIALFLTSIFIVIFAMNLGTASRKIWNWYQDFTFSAIRGQISKISPEFSFDKKTRVVSLRQFEVEVKDVCSGFEGIGLFILFISLYLFLFRDELKIGRVLSLVPIGVTVLWGLNTVRIAALILIGAFVSRGVAFQGFHYQSGWLLFLGTTLSTIALTQKSSFFRRVEPTPWLSQETPYLAPLLVFTASGMATGLAMEGAFDWLYPIRILLCGVVLVAFHKSYLVERPQIVDPWPWLVGIFVAQIWILFAPGAGSETQEIPVRLSRIDPWFANTWIFTRTFGYVIVSPFVEELAFRRFLIPYLEEKKIPYPFLFSSIAFGFLHDGWFLGFLAGLAYAWIFMKYRRAGEPFIAHAVTNGAIAALVFLTGNWSYWS